jgi:hypothetical protein
MPWGKSFETYDPESGESIRVKCETDENGAIKDVLTDLAQDKKGGKHGHIWGLNDDDESQIGGRDPDRGNDDSSK